MIVERIANPRDARQCSRDIPPPSWNPDWRQKRYGHRGDPTRCQRHPFATVDGFALCRQHAAEAVLDALLAKRDVHVPSTGSWSGKVQTGPLPVERPEWVRIGVRVMDPSGRVGKITGHSSNAFGLSSEFLFVDFDDGKAETHHFSHLSPVVRPPKKVPAQAFDRNGAAVEVLDVDGSSALVVYGSLPPVVVSLGSLTFPTVAHADAIG